MKTICIYVIDDNADNRRQFNDLIEITWSGADVRCFESVYDASQAGASPDLVIIDVSSVAPLMMGDVAHAYGPIAKFMELHPGADIIILSAMGRNSVYEVVDDVKRITQRENVFYGGWGSWEPLEKMIKQTLDLKK